MTAHQTRQYPGKASFARKCLAAVAIAVLSDILIDRNDWIGGTFGVLGLAEIVLLLLVRRDVRGDRWARGWLVAAAIMACARMWQPGWLPLVLFWAFAAMAAMIPAAERFGDAWQWLQRVVLFALRLPVAPLLDFVRWMRAGIRRGRNRPAAFAAQIALPLIGGGVILTFFAVANPVIERWLENFASFFASPEGFVFLIIDLASLVAMWSLLRPRMATRLLGTFDGSGDAAVPGVNPGSVHLSLIVFNALFALQNAMDLAWLWGLAPLPKGMTLAEYAHRGAYPLIATALLAGLFVLVALRPGSQTARHPGVVRLVVLWIAQNVLLVGNAARRTLDYIGAYSLTPWRIAALIWMALVALGLVLVLWRMVRGKSAAWLINANAGAALIVLGVLSFVDLDAVSVRYNIAHARELGGDGAPLDICYLATTGESGLVSFAALETRPAPEPIHLWARILRENGEFELRNHLGGGDWSGQGLIKMATLRTWPHLGPVPSQENDVPDCHVRDIGVLRAALGIATAQLTLAAKP